MESHIISESNPLSPAVLQSIADAGVCLDQISNIPGAVRHHILYHGRRDKATNRLEDTMFFWIYQTGCHGPQNGFRLCLVRRGFHIPSATKDAGDPDEIDLLEKDIAQGHMEVLILGEAPPANASEYEESERL